MANQESDTYVPDSLRNGIITIIPIIITFTFAFIRWWMLSSEEWDFSDIIVLIPVFIGLIILIYTLWNTLNPYKLSKKDFLRNRRSFIQGFLITLFGLLAALIL